MVNCICDQISFITSKCETQSGKKIEKCRILHALHKLRKKREQKKPLLLKLTTLRSRFTLSRAQSLLSRAVSCVWLFNT